MPAHRLPFDRFLLLPSPSSSTRLKQSKNLNLLPCEGVGTLGDPK